MLTSRSSPSETQNALFALHEHLLTLFADTVHIEGRSSIRIMRTCFAVLTGANLLCIIKLYKGVPLNYRNSSTPGAQLDPFINLMLKN